MRIRHWLFTIVFCGFVTSVQAADPGEAALKSAKEAGAFLLVAVTDGQTDAAAAKALVESVTKAGEALDNVHTTHLNADQEDHQVLIKQYRLRYAPKPIALLIAKNGAVVGSYRQPVTVEQVKAGLPGPGLQRCIEALQQGKLVLVCVQNAQSKDAAAALQGVDAFLADAKFGAVSTKVLIDPTSKEDANTLRHFQVDPKSPQAVSLLLAPPGRLIGKWNGKVTKETIASGLMAAMAASRSCGAGPSCGDPTCK